MKTKRRVKVPAKYRNVKSIAGLHEVLFPANPIEIKHEFTEIGGEKVYEYHVYVEGQWFDKEKNLLGAVNRVFEIIESQGDDWSSPSLRVNPTWPGWSQIANISLAEMSTASDELRQNNHQYYGEDG